MGLKLILFVTCAANLLLSDCRTARAAIVYNVDGTGQLTGIQNIDVGGTLYNVAFVEGSFDNIFGDAAGLDFTTSAAALAASNALAAAFNAPEAAIFDEFPNTTNGCESTLCFMWTPYSVFGSTSFLSS